MAQAVRTTAGLLEARIAHERQLAGSVAGARATVNLLTLLWVLFRWVLLRWVRSLGVRSLGVRDLRVMSR